MQINDTRARLIHTAVQRALDSILAITDRDTSVVADSVDMQVKFRMPRKGGAPYATALGTVKLSVVGGCSLDEDDKGNGEIPGWASIRYERVKKRNPIAAE